MERVVMRREGLLIGKTIKLSVAVDPTHPGGLQKRPN